MLRCTLVFVFTVLFFPNLPLLPASVDSERDSWEPGMGLHGETNKGAWQKDKQLCPIGFHFLDTLSESTLSKTSENWSKNNLVEIHLLSSVGTW